MLKITDRYTRVNRRLAPTPALVRRLNYWELLAYRNVHT